MYKMGCCFSRNRHRERNRSPSSSSENVSLENIAALVDPRLVSFPLAPPELGKLQQLERFLRPHPQRTTARNNTDNNNTPTSSTSEEEDDEDIINRNPRVGRQLVKSLAGFAVNYALTKVQEEIDNENEIPLHRASASTVLSIPLIRSKSVSGSDSRSRSRSRSRTPNPVPALKSILKRPTPTSQSQNQDEYRIRPRRKSKKSGRSKKELAKLQKESSARLATPKQRSRRGSAPDQLSFERALH